MKEKINKAFTFLNKFLLWLLLLEIGYFFIFIMFCIIIWLFSDFLENLDLGWIVRGKLENGITMPFIILFPINIAGAFSTMLLLISNRIELSNTKAWPGHILNLIYAFATGFIYFLYYMQVAFNTIGKSID